MESMKVINAWRSRDLAGFVSAIIEEAQPTSEDAMSDTENYTIDLLSLDPNAFVALDNLKRYRSGEKMTDVWPNDDPGYPPAEQRENDRRILCGAICDRLLGKATA